MTQGQALLRAIGTGITGVLEAIMAELEEGRAAKVAASELAAENEALRAENAALRAADLPETTEHPAPSGTDAPKSCDGMDA